MNRMGGRGLGSSGSCKGHVAGSCEHATEPSVSVTCREFLDYLWNR